MKALTIVLSIVSLSVTMIKSQTGISSYLPSSYSAMSQHSFGSPPESSFGGPTAYSISGFFSPTKYYGTLKKSYVKPKIYTVLSPKYAVPTTGYEVSNIKRFDDEFHHAPAHYEFQYKVHDNHHGSEFGHAESRQGDTAKGQYMVLLPDGRRQIVDYIADSHGYRPTIRYEESYDKISYGR